MMRRHGSRLWRGAGLAAPVFALRSRRSVGVGEFLDIKLLVDLCHASGQTLLLDLMWAPGSSCQIYVRSRVL